ncbi:melanin-concentrating hormone receptor 1 [Erinaceus europaeus]|uniref:Melanin-concentrating hormone receptor 1 n=1 Tax=Erinaceus europaeus TaxID=9365 RepID=A0ABM3X833_ERIEU|nr:melanin-concentrating hormone receptor 1 [Erinaceus europaeus]
MSVGAGKEGVGRAVGLGGSRGCKTAKEPPQPPNTHTHHRHQLLLDCGFRRWDKAAGAGGCRSLRGWAGRRPAPHRHRSMDLEASLLPAGPGPNASNTSDGPDNLTLAGQPPRIGHVSYINIIMPSVFGTICLLGIVGNSTVIFAVVKKSKLHWCSNVPDIFIINLSVVDLLFLLGMPFMIHQLMGNGVWHFGETMCTLITAMDANSQFTSTYILTAMAIDRYLATVHPISSTKFRKPSVATLVICLLWALSFISITPVWLYARLIPFPGGTVGCGIRLPNPDTDLYWFTLYQFFLAFALPFVVITAAYVRILQRMTSSVAPASQRSIRLRTKRVTRTAIAICLVFFVCWAPYYVLQLTQLSISRPTLTFVYLYNAAISLGYANSCLNPFVYIVLCETFRKRLVLSVKPAAQGQLRTVSNAQTADEERTESKGT